MGGTGVINEPKNFVADFSTSQKKAQHSFLIRGRGRGLKGCLEFFRKFIQIGGGSVCHWAGVLRDIFIKTHSLLSNYFQKKSCIPLLCREVSEQHVNIELTEKYREWGRLLYWGKLIITVAIWQNHRRKEWIGESICCRVYDGSKKWPKWGNFLEIWVIHIPGGPLTG